MKRRRPLEPDQRRSKLRPERAIDPARREALPRQRQLELGDIEPASTDPERSRSKQTMSARPGKRDLCQHLSGVEPRRLESTLDGPRPGRRRRRCGGGERGGEGGHNEQTDPGWQAQAKTMPEPRDARQFSSAENPGSRRVEGFAVA